ncbi:hypothetical protein SAMN05216582_10721 [Selenomonas ruminantium]|uniref:Uncharacterized protein n=1 Tax=Selenomonas ruminantium TaxID=971 RepID=A0A1M6TBK0_SELRU|nr:hypothetical protein SAMN05216582_10721 [Selenomonas ruminantium]
MKGFPFFAWKSKMKNQQTFHLAFCASGHEAGSFIGKGIFQCFLLVFVDGDLSVEQGDKTCFF